MSALARNVARIIPSATKTATAVAARTVKTIQAKRSMKDIVGGPQGSNANTFFQSRFMSTTVHPFAFASSSALSSRPTGEMRS